MFSSSLIIVYDFYIYHRQTLNSPAATTGSVPSIIFTLSILKALRKAYSEQDEPGVQRAISQWRQNHPRNSTRPTRSNTIGVILDDDSHSNEDSDEDMSTSKSSSILVRSLSVGNVKVGQKERYSPITRISRFSIDSSASAQSDGAADIVPTDIAEVESQIQLMAEREMMLCEVDLRNRTACTRLEQILVTSQSTLVSADSMAKLEQRKYERKYVPETKSLSSYGIHNESEFNSNCDAKESENSQDGFFASGLNEPFEEKSGDEAILDRWKLVAWIELNGALEIDEYAWAWNPIVLDFTAMANLCKELLSEFDLDVEWEPKCKGVSIASYALSDRQFDYCAEKTRKLLQAAQFIASVRQALGKFEWENATHLIESNDCSRIWKSCPLVRPHLSWLKCQVESHNCLSIAASALALIHPNTWSSASLEQSDPQESSELLLEPIISDLHNLCENTLSALKRAIQDSFHVAERATTCVSPLATNLRLLLRCVVGILDSWSNQDMKALVRYVVLLEAGIEAIREESSPDWRASLSISRDLHIIDENTTDIDNVDTTSSVWNGEIATPSASIGSQQHFSNRAASVQEWQQLVDYIKSTWKPDGHLGTLHSENPDFNLVKQCLEGASHVLQEIHAEIAMYAALKEAKRVCCMGNVRGWMGELDVAEVKTRDMDECLQRLMALRNQTEQVHDMRKIVEIFLQLRKFVLAQNWEGVEAVLQKVSMGGTALLDSIRLSIESTNKGSFESKIIEGDILYTIATLPEAMEELNIIQQHCALQRVEELLQSGLSCGGPKGKYGALDIVGIDSEVLRLAISLTEALLNKVKPTKMENGSHHMLSLAEKDPSSHTLETEVHKNGESVSKSFVDKSMYCIRDSIRRQLHPQIVSAPQSIRENGNTASPTQSNQRKRSSLRNLRTIPRVTVVDPSQLRVLTDRIEVLLASARLILDLRQAILSQNWFLVKNILESVNEVVLSQNIAQEVLAIKQELNVQDLLAMLLSCLLSGDLI